jgi:hypothetical protein
VASDARASLVAKLFAYLQSLLKRLPCIGKISLTNSFRAILMTYPGQSGFVACGSRGLSRQTQGIRPGFPATSQNQWKLQRPRYAHDLRCHAKLDAPAQAVHQNRQCFENCLYVALARLNPICKIGDGSFSLFSRLSPLRHE